LAAITFTDALISKDVKVKEVNDPKIVKPDDAIIRVTSTAICGSDLHLIHGMIPNMPRDFILGHETMGIVAETGPDVTKIKKGDRVIVPSSVSCGHRPGRAQRRNTGMKYLTPKKTTALKCHVQLRLIKKGGLPYI
jgi:threonine dehydrogenase-like Zn-dependent dehydrogenase